MKLLTHCPSCKKEITNGHSYIKCGCSEKEILDSVTNKFYENTKI